MKKTNRYTMLLPFIFCLLIAFIASCSPAGVKNKLTPAALPTWSTPTPYYSAPRDETLDTACRITINLFFIYKKGDDTQDYKHLFTKDAEYRADGITPPDDSRMILDLMPASDEWLRDFPGTPMPGTILPEKPNEYVYYVKFTSINRQQPEISLSYASFLPPDFMKIIVIAESIPAVSCKIANYGKG